MYKIIFYIFSALFLFACTNSQQIISNNNKSKITVSQPSKPQLTQASNLNVELGLYYLQQKQIVLAHEKFILALTQDKNNFLAYDGMAFFLENTGRTSIAEEYYLYAIKLAIKNKQNVSMARDNYGKFLHRQNRQTEATQQFQIIANDVSYMIFRYSLNSNANVK